MAVAWGIALGTVATLCWMGVRNQRTGWRKQRTDTVLDTLMVWAQANAEITASDRPNAETRVPVRPVAEPAAPAMLGDQLAALQLALSANAGVKPEPSLEGVKQENHVQVAQERQPR